MLPEPEQYPGELLGLKEAEWVPPKLSPAAAETAPGPESDWTPVPVNTLAELFAKAGTKNPSDAEQTRDQRTNAMTAVWLRNVDFHSP